jgi:hypothetical protein
LQRSDRAIYEHLCKAKQDFLMPLLQLETQLASQLADDSTPVAEHIAWLEERLGELGLANDEKVCVAHGNVQMHALHRVGKSSRPLLLSSALV